MRERAVRTILYLFFVFFKIFWIARTVFPQIHGTITKQTVKVLQSLMAGKIPTLPVLKKPIWIFHIILRVLLFCIVLLFPRLPSRNPDWKDNINAGIPSSASHLLSYRNTFALSPIFPPQRLHRCMCCHNNETHVPWLAYVPAEKSLYFPVDRYSRTGSIFPYHSSRHRSRPPLGNVSRRDQSLSCADTGIRRIPPRWAYRFLTHPGLLCTCFGYRSVFLHAAPDSRRPIKPHGSPPAVFRRTGEKNIGFWNIQTAVGDLLT